MQSVKFTGLHCDSCARLIIKKLSRIEGVQTVTSFGQLGEFQIEATIPVSRDKINNALAGSEYALVDLN